jgi:hypothetical protein
MSGLKTATAQRRRGVSEVAKVRWSAPIGEAPTDQMSGAGVPLRRMND